MSHHVKKLQFNARGSEPDVRFARLLLEQFGGPNGLLDEEAKDTNRIEKSVQKHNKSLSADRKEKVEKASLPGNGNGVMSWSVYEQEVEAKSNKNKNDK